MGQMSMNKVIHGAFRRDVGRFIAPLAAETRTAMAALLRDPGARQAESAQAAFRKLQAVTVAHLDHEESELEPVYQAKRDTPEIKAMGRAFGKSGPARGGRFFSWLLDGASGEEEAAVRAEVPGPVIAVIGGIFGRGYRRDIAPVWAGSDARR